MAPGPLSMQRRPPLLENVLIRPRRRLLTLAALSAAVAAGCGGHAEPHDAAKVVACIRAKGLEVARDRANTFAPTSRDYVITFPVGNVLLAFAPDEDVAKGVESRVRSVATANGATDTTNVVRRNGNFVYWVNAQAFPAGLTKLVDGCL
jgi:hypothetical protein